ncbi:hypothetical protein UPYG_G00015130 [Umbra pygmaea]|uniref:Lck-interacting transmembrane adapter 1 n=1 Tax=Umbra pygmaea TaxID=75934 RepID=A0ABD0XJG9_UMBPY
MVPLMDNYGKVLLLGAIAAASAFVVTIFIVTVCVGCRRKSKIKHPPANREKNTSIDMGALRQPKNSSMSKSDTRLHELNRLPCNGNNGGKNRPASMDLLLLHSRRSTSDLRPPLVRQLPQIPTSPEGEDDVRDGDAQEGSEPGARDHTYTEVGIRNSPVRCLDDGLYESVGVREADAVPPAPPPTLANTPATLRASQSPNEIQGAGARNGNGNGRGTGKGNGRGALRGRTTLGRGAGKGPAVVDDVNRSNGLGLAPQDPVMAEYASIRKVKKVDNVAKKENGSADSDDQSSVQSSMGESPSALPPLPLPLHCPAARNSRGNSWSRSTCMSFPRRRCSWGMESSTSGNPLRTMTSSPCTQRLHPRGTTDRDTHPQPWRLLKPTLPCVNPRRKNLPKKAMGQRHSPATTALGGRMEVVEMGEGTGQGVAQREGRGVAGRGSRVARHDPMRSPATSP